MIPDPALWPALALALLGAVLDIRTRRLPNWLCASLAVAAGAGLALSQGPALLPWSLLHAAIALIAGMLLFRVGAIGGGDAKLYAAAACAMPLGKAHLLLGWTSVAGLCLILGMMMMRAITRTGEPASLLRGWKVPYGAAIFGGFAIASFWG